MVSIMSQISCFSLRVRSISFKNGSKIRLSSRPPISSLVRKSDKERYSFFISRILPLPVLRARRKISL